MDRPLIPRFIILFTFIVALISAQYRCMQQCRKECPTNESEGHHPGYFEYECAGKPHHASWESWWHPQRIWGGTEETHTRGQGGSALTKDWNILYHLGGNGPWVEKVVDVVDGGIAVPQGCEVEQVHMVG
ncbi:hypothetical protein K469DRAFT_720857 [Zopfia rhizophila CBS 207.26]|uniref:Uncharacterized protein n=1 Tax=Zopfia rhizophila CBS 207.26 TaxID=1314779 RepID=A0A6A6DFK8_9PEZI|nr:hypothetical protein K469DRAFT_720857 [Zopfia rhizophila CBS 207.26]